MKNKSNKNKMKVNKKEKILGGVIAVILAVVFIISIIMAGRYLAKHKSNLSLSLDNLTRERFLSDLNESFELFANASTYMNIASDYYGRAMESYDYRDFEGAINNCREVMNYSSMATNTYVMARAKFKIILDVYNGTYTIKEMKGLTKWANASELGSEVNYYIYEACEYFISAFRYYQQCRDFGDERMCELGNGEIDRGNEKIDIHDKLVEYYNKETAEAYAYLPFSS